MRGSSGEKRKSNRSVSLERSMFLSCVRGIYASHFSVRKSFQSQDDAMVKFQDGYRASQYYQLQRTLPSTFSLPAVSKYIQKYHTVRLHTHN